MFPEMTQRTRNIVFVVAAVIIIGVVFAFLSRSPVPRIETPLEQTQREAEQKTATEKLLETDPVDPQHITNIKYIQMALGKYYNDHQTYPKKLGELTPMYARVLPKYSINGTTSSDFFYAYYPKEKPTAYHLGVLLGGRNPQDPAAFAGDADLNSEKVGYASGFNGFDPVYDIVGGKK
ncbi:MAG: hypothetical protein AAB581_02830 [Patescibacteria group bacterium]